MLPMLFGLEQVGGYVGRFDLRDAGSYALQVIVGAYFGSTDPQELPVPIPVGTHTDGCSGTKLNEGCGCA